MGWLLKCSFVLYTKQNIIDYSKRPYWILISHVYNIILYYIISPVGINYYFILWRKWKSFKLPLHVLLTDNGSRLLFLIYFKRLHNCISPYYHNYYFKFIYIYTSTLYKKLNPNLLYNWLLINYIFTRHALKTAHNIVLT